MSPKKPSLPKKKAAEKKPVVPKAKKATKERTVGRKAEAFTEPERREISLKPHVLPPPIAPPAVVTPAPVPAKSTAPPPPPAPAPKAAPAAPKPVVTRPPAPYRSPSPKAKAAPPRPHPAPPREHKRTPVEAPAPVARPPDGSARVPQPAVQAPALPAVAGPAAEAPSPKKKIAFNEMMTVKDLATVMDAKVTDVIKKLLTLGNPATINQRLEPDTATLLADAFGFELELKSIYVDEDIDRPEAEGQLKARPPVVTVMGHVDHGKTSLLDAIRSTSVAKGEAGGITQHIGAYQVKTEKGSITFLDTPGHEAFTAMRARGAMVTDVVILVVAADDSVMPQTVEAIDHARAAGVPVVVAINKVDLPVANVQKVKQELAQHELVAEDWGGKTVMVEVSAKTRHNIDKLMEMILLEAELLELKANPDRPARGVVLEARLDPKRGNTATVLVQAGTLRVGDIVVCGVSYGKIRALVNEFRQPVESSGPSQPVEILGLSQVPQVGDQLSVVKNEREARSISERRSLFVKESAHRKAPHISLESLHAQISEGKIQDLPVILKADVQGSLQAIQDSLAKISGSPIHLRYIHTGVGNINESDVLLAEASNAIVFGFNVKIDATAEAEAKKDGIDLRTYQIIYELIADVRAAMEGLLKPTEVEVVKGRALVKDVFPSSRFGSVAGCMITEGKVTRGAKGRLVRQGEAVATASVVSLKRFKDDVKEVEKGYECGISLEGVKSYARGDVIEVFVIEKHARRLEG